jgi:heme O synthase-like polyprenyltransferase
MAGSTYFVVTLTLSALYVAASLTAMLAPSLRAARRLFVTSLFYLPMVLGLLILDGVT